MSVTEGVGSVSICIAKSAETVIPITVSVDCRPLTAKSGTGFMNNELYYYHYPLTLTYCFDDRLHNISRASRSYT